MKNPVTETYTRTAAKMVTYRVLSLTVSVMLTLVYGANLSQALAFGAWAFLSGLFIYYVYERIWLLTGWRRNQSGEDSGLRSVIKAIVYRLIILAVVFASARVIFTDSNFTAMLMAASQFAANITIFFINERIWNMITWGKQIPEPEIE